MPRDLETICLKCLEKEPSRRYASAAALADDLRRFLDGEPIVARPVGGLERAVKWARRKPAIAALLSTIVMVTATGIVAVAWQWRQAVLRVTPRSCPASGRPNRPSWPRSVGRKPCVELAEAEANFALARRAVDEFLTQAGESRLLQVPGLQSLRRDLLASARRFHEEFLRGQGDDRGLRRGLAAAQLRVARIAGELEGAGASGPSFRSALASYESLARDRPDDLEVQADLADCLRGLALSEPREPAPIDLLRRAQAIRAGLAARGTANDTLSLARVQIDLAEALARASRPGEALFWYERSRDIEEKLIQVSPDDPEALATLGETLDRMAGMLERTGSPARASALRREALVYLREARDRAPWRWPTPGPWPTFTVPRRGRGARSGTRPAPSRPWSRRSSSAGRSCARIRRHRASKPR